MTTEVTVGAESRIEVDYRLANMALPQANELARRIAYEQTVELPEALIVDPYVNEHVVGRVDDVRAEGASCVATLSFETKLASGQLNQLLNLIFGNVSIYTGVRLAALRLPEDFIEEFTGPRFGIDGIRQLLGVYDRPLLATALKPRGLPVEALASLAGAFAEGGGDIVKDDQNLVEDFEAFKRRVEACAIAVARANERTGRNTLYFPHVSAAHEAIPRYLDFVYAMGLHGVLVCPVVLGLDTTRALLADYPFVTMAHPALAGSYVLGSDEGMAHDVLLGTLMRLAGADVSIFPSFGGRFSFSESVCGEIAARLTEPLGSLAPTWPCPAGGMQFSDMASLARTYGRDSVLLVGGALFGHADSLVDGTRAFIGEIESVHPGRYVSPSALSSPGRLPHGVADAVHRFLPNFEWEGRPSSPYKSSNTPLPGATAGGFEGVRRVELVGKYGERTNADLRYFEVQPGGFSSHERHVHPHIIIAARGKGTLILGNEQQVLGVNDVAYVGPLVSHQLRTEGDEPFGFFCIVDHDRDRPMSPR